MEILKESLSGKFEPVFNVVTRLIKLENQGIVKRYIVQHKPCVSILVYDPTTDLFYLGYEYRSGVNEYRYGNPAGFIDDGETPIESAKRELREELGLISDKLTFITTLSSSEGFTDEEVHLFYAEGPFEVTETEFDEEEYIQLNTLLSNELSELVVKNKIKSAPTMLGYYWWLNNIKKGKWYYKHWQCKVNMIYYNSSKI